MSQITYQGFGTDTGFKPYPLEPYGQTTATGRCALVTDTHTFPAVNGKPSPFASGINYSPIGKHSSCQFSSQMLAIGKV